MKDWGWVGVRLLVERLRIWNIRVLNRLFIWRLKLLRMIVEIIIEKDYKLV